MSAQKLGVSLLWGLLNSQEWPRQNFSLQYKYNIKQISDENKEKYKFGDSELTQY